MILDVRCFDNDLFGVHETPCRRLQKEPFHQVPLQLEPEPEGGIENRVEEVRPKLHLGFLYSSGKSFRYHAYPLKIPSSSNMPWRSRCPSAHSKQARGVKLFSAGDGISSQLSK